MGINASEFYEILTKKGIRYLYHANTVTTACTFIEQGGLLSRGEVQNRDLNQTEQDSDLKDKRFGVWDNIFLDILDMHGYFPRENLYGPVCFVMKSELLLDSNLKEVFITKDNPLYWNEYESLSDRYYISLDEYIHEFDDNINNHTIQKKMPNFKFQNGELLFEKYLEYIILDDPNVRLENSSIDLYTESYNILKCFLQENNFDSKLLKRRSCSDCWCKKNYSELRINELEKKFLYQRQVSYY